jgi:hypothetical protein
MGAYTAQPMTEIPLGNDAKAAARARPPISARDLQWVRRIAGGASILLIGWAAVFVYALTRDPDERDALGMFVAVLLILIIAAAGLAWWRPRPGGATLIGLAAIVTGAIILPGPDPTIAATWTWNIIGAAIWSAPSLIVGLLWLWYVRLASGLDTEQQIGPE